MENIKERYQASMVLHGVGDAMGYRNGKWEFKFSGEDIHEELTTKFGGIENLDLNRWKVSDDTVLHLANAECLIEHKDLSPFEHKIYQKLVRYYKEGMHDMKDRAPGNTTIQSVSHLTERETGYQLKFNPSGGGCGVSMRSSCIGLRYSRRDQIEDLVAFAIESGRMTHHHPIGYLGGVAAALMTSYAIQDIPIKAWGKKCLEDLVYAENYIKNNGRDAKENLDAWNSFTGPWKKYLKVRNIENGENEPQFQEKFGVKERDEFYKTISGLRNWAGALGHDSVLIAYDALLGCKGDWKELCLRAMLHGGDNDSTGCIAGSWYGALYGFNGVPEINYRNLEYKDRLFKCGELLFNIQN